MSEIKNKAEWEEYCAKEIEDVTPILSDHGYVLDSEQPHIGGERYLMQAVTTASGKKLALLGTRKEDGVRVVIKISRDRDGKREIEHELSCRDVLKQIRFAYDTFFSPKKLLHLEEKDFLIFIQEYLPQEKPFLERSTEEQFSYALKAFNSQESAHATTYSHIKLIEKTFDIQTTEEYLATYKNFENSIQTKLKEDSIQKALGEGYTLLESQKETIEQYLGFLTHVDFVPHNFRIANGRMYLLDHSSIRFGNKYEGWARFVNFMTLHNPELAHALETYVKDNRSPEEVLSLKLMRIHRLAELMYYYTNTLSKSSGNLLELNQLRVTFWSEVFVRLLHNQENLAGLVEEYRAKRNALRSEDEKKRQKDLL